MKKYWLAVDLKKDSTLINEYVKWNRNIWPDVLTSIKDSGIMKMEIHRFDNRLFMTMETDDLFLWERNTELTWETQRCRLGKK